MNNIKSFLGFTNTIKEPRKTRVENSLAKLISSKGIVYNTRTFLLNKLLEGRQVKKVDDIITYNKRTLEQNKPKTEYRLIDTEKNCYYEMNKTEYDFCIYCIDNGYITIESIENYITEEEKRLQAVAEQEAENKHIQAEKERAEQEEIERIHTMIKEEVETLPEEEKQIMNSIFLSMLGMEADNRSYTLISCIHHFGNAVCKNEIISRLHNDNVASIKTFECITGLKLPKCYKERIAYLNSITSADFTGLTEYKERKKAEQKDIITEEFYINQKDNNGCFHWKKVIGEPYTKNGIDFFIQCINGQYNISEIKTGSLFAYGKNKTEAKQKVDSFFQEKGKEKILELIEQMYTVVKKTAGDNPRYNMELNNRKKV